MTQIILLISKNKTEQMQNNDNIYFYFSVIVEFSAV